MKPLTMIAMIMLGTTIGVVMMAMLTAADEYDYCSNSKSQEGE